MAFCERWQCDDEDFAVQALTAFLHQPWGRLAPLLYQINPRLLATDLLIIEQLGRVTSGKNLTAEIRDLRADYLRQHDFGLLRRALRMRLSGRRITKSCERFWAGHTD